MVTYATSAFGRSISMVPSYNRATQAAERIIALIEQQSHIDPEAVDGLKLVRIVIITIYIHHMLILGNGSRQV